QRVTVKVRLSQLGKLVSDPALTKLLARPLATVTIADHVADAIRLQQFGEFISHGLGAKRRPRFAECIDDDGVIVLMGNRKCHAILRPATRVNEGLVSDIAARRQLAITADAALDHIKADEALKIGSEFGQVFSRSARAIFL